MRSGVVKCGRKGGILSTGKGQGGAHTRPEKRTARKRGAKTLMEGGKLDVTQIKKKRRRLNNWGKTIGTRQDKRISMQNIPELLTTGAKTR